MGYPCWFCPYRKDEEGKRPYCLLKQKLLPPEGEEFCNGQSYSFKKKRKFRKR